MDIHSDIHYINTSIFFMRRKNQLESFIIFTKYILEFQQRNKIDICNNSHISAFGNISSVTDEILLETYKSDIQLFKLFMKYSKRMIPVNKVTDEFFKQFDGDTVKNIRDFLNFFVVLNILKRQIKNKSVENIKQYKLYEKIKHICSGDENIFTCLNLTNLSDQDNYQMPLALPSKITNSEVSYFLIDMISKFI